MEATKRQVRRLHNWILALTIVMLAGAVAAPIIGSAIIEANQAETQLTVVCVSAKANVSQLEALAAISRRIGIPVDFAIPTLPEECDQ